MIEMWFFKMSEREFHFLTKHRRDGQAGKAGLLLMPLGSGLWLSFLRRLPHGEKEKGSLKRKAFFSVTPRPCANPILPFSCPTLLCCYCFPLSLPPVSSFFSGKDRKEIVPLPTGRAVFHELPVCLSPARIPLNNWNAEVQCHVGAPGSQGCAGCFTLCIQSSKQPCKARLTFPILRERKQVERLNKFLTSEAQSVVARSQTSGSLRPKVTFSSPFWLAIWWSQNLRASPVGELHFL